jgi:hypothetical protein
MPACSSLRRCGGSDPETHEIPDAGEEDGIDRD